MLSDDGSLFDGLEEVHSQYERGESYGLERQTYARMAQCAIACSRAGVEPSTIRKLTNDRPGCDLTLYGSQAAYTIRVEEGEERFIIRLFVIGLDVKYMPLTPVIWSSKGKIPSELVQGHDDNSRLSVRKRRAIDIRRCHASL